MQTYRKILKCYNNSLDFFQSVGSNTWLLRVLFLRRPQRLCQGSQCWVLHTLNTPGVVPMPFCQASPQKWMCRGGTGGVLTKQSVQKPKLSLFALCAFQYHPESSTYWATSTLARLQSWHSKTLSKWIKYFLSKTLPKAVRSAGGCEHHTSQSLFTGGWLDIFVLGSVVVHVSAVPVSGIAEYSHTQRNMYI